MAAAKSKTQATQASVASFINAMEDPVRRADCRRLAELIGQQTGFAPKMWGPSIIGFGSYHYKYESGREGDAPLVGFSPRKSEFALYIANFDGKEGLLEKLGKHKTAKACVYIKKLDDINVSILQQLVAGSVNHYREKYP
jgi:hypothetical protein